MNSAARAIEVGNDNARMRSIAADWYALNPDVTRLWVYEVTETGARGIHVVVALAPVCDSEETTPIWLARCDDWQRQLQDLFGSTVRLEWFDAQAEVAPCTEGTERSRACLASVAWRGYDG